MNSAAEEDSRRRLAAHLLLIAVTLVWGASFPLVKAALRVASPGLFNLLRMALAALLLLVLHARSLRGLSRLQWRLCAGAGVVLALGYELQTAGLARTTPSRSAFLTGLVVVLVPLLSALPGVRSADTATPHPTAYAGAALAFAGIVLLTSVPGTGWALLAGLHVGEWLTLLCAVAYAFHLLLLARGAREITPRVLGTLQIAFAAVAMLVFLPLTGPTLLHWNATLVWALLVTSVLATAAAFTIQSWAQQYLPATHTALILTLEPVFAWLTSLIFLGERLGARALLGAGLILLGIVLSEMGPAAWRSLPDLPL